ncbi:MAG: hypothetical protein C4294_18555 [Nitrospiraceae bacterium]
MLTKKEKSNHERFPYKWVFLTPPIIITYIAWYLLKLCAYGCSKVLDWAFDIEDDGEPNKKTMLRETLLEHERTFTAAVCILGIALTIISAIQ